MKILIMIFLLSTLAVSCGQKAAGSKAKFKIFSGAITDPATVFPGGLLVMGRHSDDSQSFILPYSPGMELDLKKGLWEFATIGWMGASPMEGNQQCSYQKIDVNTDVFSVTFEMNYSRCLSESTIEGKRFVHPLFYNSIGGTNNGFKKLDVKQCSDITSCSTQTAPGSFRVSIDTRTKGMIARGAPFSSDCNNGYSSNIAPPYGGPNGFIGLKIEVFSGTNCSGTMKEYFFDHGFGEKLDRTFVDPSGVTQIRRGALSVDPNATSSVLALASLKFLGAWTVSSSLPSVADDGDLYIYHNVTQSIVTPYALDEDFLLYDGSSWSKFANDPHVKLLLEL